MALVNELHLGQVSLIEDYAHDCLTGTHRTVDLGVYLVDTHRIAHSHKRIKYILTELLSLNHNLLALGVDVWVKDSERIDSVGLLGDTGSDGPWVQSIEAGSTYN